MLVKNFNHHIPVCYLQFYGNHANDRMKIIIEDTNLVYRYLNKAAGNINCKMSQNPLFYEHNPLHIYRHSVYRKLGNFYVEIIHVVNIHVNLFSWVYGTHENILT